MRIIFILIAFGLLGGCSPDSASPDSEPESELASDFDYTEWLIIAEQIKRTPPSCISGFHQSPAELPETWDDNFTTAYCLSCKTCKSETGEILGHLLKDYNPEYDGLDLITPLGFRCSKCETVTEIIDTDIHGYHAEVAKIDGGIGSSKIRGEGPRTARECPNCTCTEFNITVGFVYWDFDIMIDDPELAGQEFFNVFLIYAHCQECGEVSRVTDLGKL